MFNDQTAASDATDAPPTDPLTVVADEGTEASREQLAQLAFLSQAPLTLEAALEQEAVLEETASAPLTAAGLIRQYARFVGLLIGVGMVTASVRHWSDGTGLYAGVAAAGALLFAIASTVGEPRLAGRGLGARLRHGATSLLLGASLGLLVGGIVHFSAIPKTAAVLVPVGLLLSIAAFVARDGRALLGKELISVGVTVAGLLVWLGVGLGVAAKKIDPSPTPTPAAAHGAPAAAGEHGAAAEGEHGETAAAAAGEHGEAAAAAEGEHGEAAAAEGEHGETAAAAGDHGEAAAGEHGDTAAAADHGAAADDHATAAKSATAEHAPAKAATDHAPAKADASASHGATAKTESGHGAAASAKEEEEDEVTADDVLAPVEGH